ncbi:MAG: pectate lyase [Halioglobus sp.]|jgi:pectate lyase
MKKRIAANCILAIATFNVFAQQTATDSLTVDEMLWTLPDQVCANEPTSWTQTEGPSVAINNGDNTVEISTPARYEFAYECCLSASNRVERLLNSPDRLGFGKPTTGGALAEQYTVVTNLNDDGPGSLRDALNQPTPIWITFDSSIKGGTIYLKSGVVVHTKDITIDGSGSDITISPDSGLQINMLQLRGGNTILHDLTFDGKQTKSLAMMIREGDFYWIDHVTSTNFIYNDSVAVGQGSRPLTSASEVTASNFHAYNTSKGFQAGGNDNFPNFPRHRTTIHSSILAGEDRNPRIQYGGQVHVFNSYIHSFTYAGMDAGRSAEIFSENNVFSALNAKNPANAQTGRPAGSGPTGHIYSTGDIFLDVAGSTGSIDLSGVSPFSLPYEYNAKPTSEVIDYVLANAGAGKSSSSSSSCSVVTKDFTYSID